MREPYFEVQSNLVKNYTKIKNLIIGQTDTHVFFTTDGYVLHIIPKEYWLLDTQALLGKREMVKKDLIEQFDALEFKPAVIKHIMPHSTYKEIAVLQGGDTVVWVAQKYLKKFPKDVSLDVSGEITGVRVTFNGEVCGYIMPIRQV